MLNDLNCDSYLYSASATNTQQIWRQEFLGSRSSTVERSSTRTVVAGTFLRFLQTIFENTSLWRLKRLVSLSTYRRCINKCIYLSIYLFIHRRAHAATVVNTFVVVWLDQLIRQYEQSPVKYDADALEFQHAREIKQRQKVKRRSSLKTYKVSRFVGLACLFSLLS